MKILGKVVSGSLNKGIKVVLHADESIESYPIGSLITIRGENYTYLGIITDAGITSDDTNAYYMVNPRISNLVKDLLLKTSKDVLRTQWVEIALLAQSSGGNANLADTVPCFASSLVETNENEIREFFGMENRMNLWGIGYPKTPKDILVEIPIDVKKLVSLSFGIFGKSGTGKTFLGNLLAGYIVMYDLVSEEDKKLKLLIFDMHTEYALELKDNMGNPIADGVAKIFRMHFLRYTPDEEIARERNLRLLKLNLRNITLDDITMIAPVFGVSPAFLQYLRGYKQIISKELKLGDLWVIGLLLDETLVDRLNNSEDGRKILDQLSVRLNMDRDFISNLRNRIYERIKSKLGVGAAQAFITQSTKLRRIMEYPFTVEEDPISEIVENLVKKDGMHITISLGKYEKETPLYMLIANLIARKLREKIIEKSLKGEELETKIIIFLEEAHNFLGRETYRTSPFGDIAREMRKKGVILCVIDQRPSELDPDVISMLWTNFVFALTEKHDINTAVLGAPRSHLFEKIIPVLRNREVFIYGQAVRFPVIVKIRDYKVAEDFFKNESRKLASKIEESIEMLREQGLL